MFRGVIMLDHGIKAGREMYMSQGRGSEKIGH